MSLPIDNIVDRVEQTFGSVLEDEHIKAVGQFVRKQCDDYLRSIRKDIPASSTSEKSVSMANIFCCGTKIDGRLCGVSGNFVSSKTGLCNSHQSQLIAQYANPQNAERIQLFLDHVGLTREDVLGSTNTSAGTAGKVAKSGSSPKTKCCAKTGSGNFCKLSAKTGGFCHLHTTVHLSPASISLIHSHRGNNNQIDHLTDEEVHLINSARAQ